MLLHSRAILAAQTVSRALPSLLVSEVQAAWPKLATPGGLKGAAALLFPKAEEGVPRLPYGLADLLALAIVTPEEPHLAALAEVTAAVPWQRIYVGFNVD